MNWGKLCSQNNCLKIFCFLFRMNFLFFIIYSLYIFSFCARLFQICTCVLLTMALISFTELKKKARFPANSTRVQRPIDAGAELKPVWSIEGREKKFILTLPQWNRNSKVDFSGGWGGSKVFTVKTRTEKLSTNITRDPNKLVWEVGCTDKCFNFSPSFWSFWSKLFLYSL